MIRRKVVRCDICLKELNAHYYEFKFTHYEKLVMMRCFLNNVEKHKSAGDVL